jgi:hypothetical protein
MTRPPSIAPSLTYNAPKAPATDVSGNATRRGRDKPRLSRSRTNAGIRRRSSVPTSTSIPCGKAGAGHRSRRPASGAKLRTRRAATRSRDRQTRRHQTELALQAAVGHTRLTAQHRDSAAASAAIELDDLRLAHRDLRLRHRSRAATRRTGSRRASTWQPSGKNVSSTAFASELRHACAGR